MKTRTFRGSLIAIAAVTGLSLATNIVAQDTSTSASTSATTPNAAQTAAGSGSAPQLSYGVPQVLQLSQAKIGDSTIVAYIQNTGTIYSLNASEIVYLKQQGVSDAVITTMLNQRQRVTQAAVQTAPQAPATATTSQPGSAETSTAVAQPTVTYVQTVPSSTVYVIPDTQTLSTITTIIIRHYGYYPYYGGWYYPAVSFSFGFGGGYRGGWDGYHGGWHR